MDKDVIRLDYTELRLMTEKVLSYVRDICGDTEQVGLKSRLENDLGMTGDDVSEFLTRFSEKFEVNFTGFDFDKHFNIEGFSPIELLLAVPVLTFVISFNCFKLMIDFVGYKYKLLEEIDRINYPGKILEFLLGKEKKDLMIGDLVVFYVTRKFLKREEVFFELQ